MNWFGPTGDCGCCDPCTRLPYCTEPSGFAGREPRPDKITLVLDNIPNSFNLTNTQFDAYDGSLNLYYPLVNISNVSSIEGTYVLNLETEPQDNIYACRYTSINYTPSTSMTVEVTPDQTGCPGLIVGRTITNVSSSFSVGAYFLGVVNDVAFLIVYCQLIHRFTTVNQFPVLTGSNSYAARIQWLIPSAGNWGKLCGTTSGDLLRDVNLINTTLSVNGSEKTDCAAYGPQPDDDSTWQYD